MFCRVHLAKQLVAIYLMKMICWIWRALYQSDFGVDTTEEIISVFVRPIVTKSFRGEDANIMHAKIKENFGWP